MRRIWVVLAASTLAACSANKGAPPEVLSDAAGSSTTFSTVAPAASSSTPDVSTSTTGPTVPTTAPSTSGPTVEPSTITPPTAGTLAPAATTTKPATSRPSSSVPRPSATAARSGPAITPVAFCSDGERTYFGYTNDSDAPVVIPAGTANRVFDADTEVPVRLPTVFAPGQVGPVFWANESAVPPTWSVTSPDGTTRTARLVPGLPFCTETEETINIPDDRSPKLEVTFSALPTGSTNPDRLTVTYTATGIPELSVCPTGLTPLPPTVGTDDAFESPFVDGRVYTETIDFVPRFVPQFESVEVHRAGTARALLVFDNCAFGSTVSTTWAMTPAFERARRGGAYCFEDVAGVVTLTRDDFFCELAPIRLPATGGVRKR